MDRDAIVGALELLPRWVPWANVLLVAPLGALLAFAGAGATALVAGPARPVALRRMAGALPFVIALAALFLNDGLQHLHHATSALLTWLAATAATLVATRHWGVATANDAGAAQRREWNGLTAIVASRLARPVIAAVVATSLDPAATGAAACIAIVGLAAYLAARAPARMALLLRAGIYQPASPRLVDALASAAQRTNRAVPRAFEIELPYVTAAALRQPATLFFSRRAIERFDDVELRTLCLGLLGHVAAPSTGRLAAALGHAAMLLLASARFVALQVPGTVLAAALAALLVAAALASRRAQRRSAASAEAFALARGAEPGEYTRIHTALLASAREPLPRPAGARRPRRAVVAQLLGAIVVAVPLAFSMMTAIESTLFPAEFLGWPRDVVLAVGHRPELELLRRAAAAHEAGDAEGADRLVAAARSLEGDDGGWLRRLAMRLFVVQTIDCGAEER